MKLRFLALGCFAAALLLASAAPRAEAHGIPAIEGGSLHTEHVGPFNATYVLTKGLRAEAVPCQNGSVGGLPSPPAFACKNIDLLAQLNTNALAGNGSGADITGWTDPATGKEYALQGHSNATSFTDVSDVSEPTGAPIYLGSMPSLVTGALWRELGVYNNHAYVVQDTAGLGMQIFDLTRLRGAAPPLPGANVVYPADATWRGPQSGTGSGFSTVHTVTINPQTGFAYLDGGNACPSGSPHVIDLKPNPKAPVFVGCIVAEQSYVHDAQCVIYHGPDTAHAGKEICVFYTGQGTRQDTMTVYDVTNKSPTYCPRPENPCAPVMLSRVAYLPASGSDVYTHQGWFTENQKYILVDDELDESGPPEKTKTFIYDMSDLDAPVLLSDGGSPGWEHQTSCTDHNQYIRGSLSYQSNYACGLRIMSLSEVGQGKLNELAYFDTAPSHDFIAGASDGGDTQGDWANYPYFESGIVITSNISIGLFVLKPNLGPTAVKVASFAGRQTGKRVTLTWRTASESDILGFRVFRYGQGKRVILTKSLVSAKSLSRPGGARYSVVDQNARPGAYTYKLQVVDKQGRRAFKASATVRVRR